MQTLLLGLKLRFGDDAVLVLQFQLAEFSGGAGTPGFHGCVDRRIAGLCAQEFEDSLAAVMKGPLPEAALDRLAALQQGFVGEAR